MSERWRSTFTFVYSREQLTNSRHINDLFNDGLYWQRAELGGEFQQHCIYSRPPRADSNFKPGTLSQMIVYHIDYEFQARVHQMLLPDDEKTSGGLPRLAGYGEPDCKELIEDDVYYYLPTPKTPKAIRRREYLMEEDIDIGAQ